MKWIFGAFLIVNLWACSAAEAQAYLELQQQIELLQQDLEDGVITEEVYAETVEKAVAAANAKAQATGGELPIDPETAGIYGALGLGLFNQFFGSRRSAKLEKANKGVV